MAGATHGEASEPLIIPMRISVPSLALLPLPLLLLLLVLSLLLSLVLVLLLGVVVAAL